MKIFVISLLEDLERRRSIDGQLGRLQLPYETLPAVRGADLSPEEKRRHYDEKWFVRYQGRPAMPGELGCALSHLMAYRLVLERALPHALILEDDAWLNPNLPQLLQAIERDYLATDRSVCLLTWASAGSHRSRSPLWASYDVADLKSAMCAHGYVVSNSAARVLVETLYPVRHLADCWDWLRRHRIVNIRAIFPPCITADLSYETRTTGELGQVLAQRSRLRRLGHKVHRAFWRVADHLLATAARVGAISSKSHSR